MIRLKTRLHGAVVLMAFSLTTSACAQSSADSHAITQALSAAPEDLAEGATVYGYNEDGTYRVIREGSNSLFCVSDDPNRDGFEAICFHRDLEPYLSRGRELRAGGMSGRETVNKRGEEIAAGTLSFVSAQSTLYIRYGDEARYDEASGEVLDSRLRYVIYIPDATSESSGLPESPMAPGAPWIMDPGSWRAHIMIVPPPPED